MHPEVGREEVRDRLALREPVRDVVELRRVHSANGTRTITGYAELLAAIDGALQRLLRHPRAALDPHPLRLVVQLLLRAPLRPFRARANPAAVTRGDVSAREPRRGLRLA